MKFPDYNSGGTGERLPVRIYSLLDYPAASLPGNALNLAWIAEAASDYFVTEDFTTEASKMLWMVAFNRESNSEADCCAVRPSSNAREKLAMTP